MKITDLDTPALLIDLDRFEANLQRWQKFCSQHGVKNRPHIKTHKIPELACMQVEGGAVGVTCQKLGEAEAMAAGGITDIFLTYNIVGEAKLQRLTELHRQVDLRVVADGKEVVDGLERAAARAEKPLDVLVECDTGMHRIGVQTPAVAADLAQYISSRKHLRFAGFCTYPTTPEALEFMRTAKQLTEAKGIEVLEISGGGTPGMWKLAEYEGFTEYRVGTYYYSDRIIVAEKAAEWKDCAATILVSVISTAGESWVTVDGGTKTFSTDQYGQTGFGILLDHPGGMLVRCSEEHGVLQINGEKPTFQIGEKLRVIPNHACIVSNLHERAFGVRGDEVVAEWAVTARGKLQ